MREVISSLRLPRARDGVTTSRATVMSVQKKPLAVLNATERAAGFATKDCAATVIIRIAISTWNTTNPPTNPRVRSPWRSSFTIMAGSHAAKSWRTTSGAGIVGGGTETEREVMG